MWYSLAGAFFFKIFAFFGWCRLAGAFFFKIFCFVVFPVLLSKNKSKFHQTLIKIIICMASNSVAEKVEKMSSL